MSQSGTLPVLLPWVPVRLLPSTIFTSWLCDFVTSILFVPAFCLLPSASAPPFRHSLSFLALCLCSNKTYTWISLNLVTHCSYLSRSALQYKSVQQRCFEVDHIQSNQHVCYVLRLPEIYKWCFWMEYEKRNLHENNVLPRQTIQQWHLKVGHV